MDKLIKALPDTLIIAGACVGSYGAWLLLPAAGFIVGGVLLVAGGVVASGKSAKVEG